MSDPKDENAKPEEEKKEEAPQAEIAEEPKAEKPEEKAEAPQAEKAAEKVEEKPAEKAPEPPKEEPKAEKPAKEDKPKADVKLSKDAEKILDLVKKLSVMDMANLVKAMEDEFGVSAAAPVAVAAAPGGAPAGGGDAGDDDDGPSEVNIELTEAGAQKIAVIKAVREVTQIGLKDAKDLVDGAPKVIKEGVPKKEADEMKKKLEEAGAKVTFK